jgi:TPR repeat protein
MLIMPIYFFMPTPAHSTSIKNHWNALSQPLIASILSNLGPHDLQHVAETSRFMREIAKNTHSLRPWYVASLTLEPYLCPKELETLAIYGFLLVQDDVGLNKDEKAGVDYFEKAAKKGCALGMALFGDALIHGLGGREKNKKKAVRYFEKSAKAGCELGKALYGEALLDGFGGLAKDMPQASKYIEESARAGCGLGLALHGTVLLLKFLASKETTYFSESVQYFERSALAGNPSGMVLFGQALHHGLGGLEPDLAKAVEFYKKSAACGHGQGQALYGDALYHGIGGIKKDEAEGIKYYEKSAKSGSPTGMALCSETLYHDSEKNRVLSIKWSKLLKRDQPASEPRGPIQLVDFLSESQKRIPQLQGIGTMAEIKEFFANFQIPG